MNEIGKKVLKLVCVNMIAWGICEAAINLMQGKDILGRKKKVTPKEKTYMNWQGDVVLGYGDYEVV